MRYDQDLPFQQVKITRQEEIAPGVFILFMPRPFDFKAGQVCGLKLTSADPYRLYSICTGEYEEEIGFLYNIYPEGMLTPKLAETKVGDKIWISDPTGSFILPEGPASLIATGTGIAPFMSLQKSGKIAKKTLIHGARTREHLYGAAAFREALGFNYIPCCSRDSGEDIYAGRLTEYIQGHEEVPTELNYYLCGSPSMVVTVRELLISKNVPFDNILSEIYF